MSSVSAAVAADAAFCPTACFTVVAQPEPAVLPRVVELFAKRGLVPQRCHATASMTALSIDVQIGGLDREVADYIARCMRQIVGVETVLTTELSGG